MDKTKEIARNKNGTFCAGVSGNPNGRPEGSKNQITVAKLLLEDAFRQGHADDIMKVLSLIVKQAKTGDKASQKLIWDSSISKQAIEADRASGSKQEINVKTMNVTQGSTIEGEFVDETQPEETLQ